jgi:hypothetical protein
MGNYYSENASRESASSSNSRQRRSMARGFMSVFGILIVIALFIGGLLIFNNSSLLGQPTVWNLPTLGNPGSAVSDVPCEILIQKAIEASGQTCNSAIQTPLAMVTGRSLQI